MGAKNGKVRMNAYGEDNGQRVFPMKPKVNTRYAVKGDCRKEVWLFCALGGSNWHHCALGIRATSGAGN